MKKIKILASILLSLVSFSSLALNLNDLQGDSKTTYSSPRGVQEVCVVPKKWPGGMYKKEDPAKETTLCSYDFHRNVGICPKYTSTNPAILLLEPTAQYPKEVIDASQCNYKAMDLNNEAKFKQSISCSYTPAILAYYHVSRALGGGGQVPVNVIRTMDIRIHEDLANKAVNHLRDSKDLIKTIWEQFARTHQNPQNYPLLYDSTQTQVYGALIDNIKKEEQYIEVSGTGSYDRRYERFMQQKPFLRLTDAQSVSQSVGTSDFTKVAQIVLQMKDVSDMVILDRILSQQDRIGNIHFKLFWYFVEPGSNTFSRKKSDAKIENGKIIVPPAESQIMAGKQAVLLKEMILKDNDCGVIKTNMMKEVGALEKVRHLSYSTYRHLLRFAQDLNSSAAKDFFKAELLFSENDFAGIFKNTQEVRNILVTKCQQGQLHFDVDLEDYVPGAKPPARSCL
ncbi:hypothetical protein AZI86_02985 [Bdellovibrio bacteriovorus]|uniref:Periplasmic protein n=1 Tax=Bdellovibrio bacteriovorus TaxID=959 RepID=A0A150WP15_BDEBC|nr:hypothetical protein [Bdellovibrio bacteriovorus]KYG66047.1 hypothetical protein AZI86_02985 [Bdellovibrio bacteriovorus]